MRELIERLENEGASYDLDVTIAQDLVPQIVVMRQRNDDTGADPHTYRCFTTKIDDAVWLAGVILPGWACGFDGGPKTNIAFVDPHDYADRFTGARYTAEGPTPAIALCLAILRAKDQETRG